MDKPSAKAQLMQLIMGNWVSQSVYVAAKLKIADHLASGPKTAAELAEAAGCHTGALYRLLRALASVGVFTEHEGQQFSLADIGNRLRDDAPESARNSSIMVTEVFYPTWGQLLHSLQTGETAFEKVHGKPIFDYLAENLDKATVFDAAMISWMNEEAAAIISSYQWPERGEIVDIGGGSGGLIRAVLEHGLQLEGTIFDLPEVIERNHEFYQSDEIFRRCKFKPGDFFSSIPGEAAIYLLRNIIHDWSDEDSVKILRNCRDSCRADSTVLLLEYVIPAGNEPFGGKWLDLMMLAGVGGRERTETEYRKLLNEAGLQMNRVIATGTDMSIIEARPI